MFIKDYSVNMLEKVVQNRPTESDLVQSHDKLSLAIRQYSKDSIQIDELVNAYNDHRVLRAVLRPKDGPGDLETVMDMWIGKDRAARVRALAYEELLVDCAALLEFTFSGQPPVEPTSPINTLAPYLVAQALAEQGGGGRSDDPMLQLTREHV